MIKGSPNEKRDRALRDRLVSEGILVKDSNPELYRFSSDYEFSSASAAGGVVRDGNCSGPGAWIRVSDGVSLRDVQS